MPRENVIGQRYGLLTITKDLPDAMDGAGRWRRMVECVCDCGNTTEKKLITLRHQSKHHITSCGCNRKGKPSPNLKHNMTLTKEYKAWKAMKRRCYAVNDISYPRYGGRGITVCKRWRDSFKEFYKDMGPMPKGRRVSLERTNNHRPYQKGNCRWATPQEQANNRSNNKLIGGKTLAQHAREHNIHPDLVGRRLKRGWSLEKALTTPPNKGGDNSYLIGGKTLSQHAKEHGIPPEIVCTRVNRDGWSLDEALNVPVGAGRKARIEYLKNRKPP